MDRELETKVREGLARLADDAGEPSADLRRRVLREAAARRRRSLVLFPAAALATVAAVIAGALVVQRQQEDPGVHLKPAEDAPGPDSRAPAPEGWRPLAEAPIQARRDHVSVWTGTQMLIWGGTDGEQDFDDGAAYDLDANTWKGLPAAPIAGRAGATAVWTGTHLLVWGGLSSSGGGVMADGAAFDPKRDEWAKLPPSPLSGRLSSAAVWTGKEMVIWGGASQDGVLRDGAAYDPVKERWRLVDDGPSPRAAHSMVWTGTQAVVWGGRREGETSVRLTDGLSYDAANDAWTPMAEAPDPGRDNHTAVWTGKVMFVWGGTVSTADGTGEMAASNGAIYDPSSDSWTTVDGYPAARAGGSVVWTGREVLVWGGPADDGEPSGAAFHPEARGWVPMAPSPLSERTGHTAVWTGQSMLVWGGSAGETPVADGAVYHPPRGEVLDGEPGDGEHEGPATGGSDACAGEFPRGEKGVRAFVNAFYATRVRGATGVEDCITTEAKQQQPSLVRQCGVGGGRRDFVACVRLSLEDVEVLQADANSWEVTVTRGVDCRSDDPIHYDCIRSVTETLFIGPGRNLDGEQRALLVRGIDDRKGPAPAPTSTARSS